MSDLQVFALGVGFGVLLSVLGAGLFMSWCLAVGRRAIEAAKK